MGRWACLVLLVCLACLNAPSKAGPGDRSDAADVPLLDEIAQSDLEPAGDAVDAPLRDISAADETSFADSGLDATADPGADPADVPPDLAADLPPDSPDVGEVGDCAVAADCPPLPCNSALCVAGMCAYHPFADGSPCDDANPCTIGESCASGKCSGGVPANCDDANPCTQDVCVFPDGCAHYPKENPCDDHNACTEGDFCDDGVCVATKAVDCDDANSCTADTCDPTLGCVHAMLSLPCDDGNACTTGDVCAGGSCAGTPANCDDGNPCTTDSCDPASGCGHVPSEESCDDHNACTEGDACADGNCAPGAPVACDDANECTSDTCVAQVGCIHLSNKNPCEDGNLCTTGESCSEKECVGGKPVDCDDDNPCTEDSCVQAAGCVHVAVADGTICDVGNCSTDDTCQDGKCIGTGKPCDDGNPCTEDFCLDGSNCAHTNNTRPCDDKNACTVQDACVNGKCTGTMHDCNDGNPCTDDSCNEQTGCIHAPNTAQCDDANACTAADRCADGACAGSPLDCDDANPCTSDSCDLKTGCVHLPRTGQCDDGNVCTVQDSCVNGKCTGASPMNCDDGNVCTTDSCDPKTGCVHAPNTLPCDDANKCTTGDVCASGKCAGKPVTCDDANVCTTDDCVPATGCVFTPNTLPCDDKSPCTASDTCVNGECEGVDTCDDGNPCTKDGCDSTSGCTHTPIPVWTPCGTNSWCDTRGICQDTCVKSCPQGLGAWDGCHCPVLPTAVTLCSDGTSVTDCKKIGQGSDGYGQDGHFPSGSLKYEIPANGQIRDKISNLIWKTAYSDPVTYANASAKCVSGDPGTSWRLPLPMELLGIVDYSKSACPVWDSTFGACPANPAGFWTSSLGGATESVFLFSVLFGAGSTTESGGMMRATDKEQYRRVRCIKSSGSIAVITDRFVDMGDDSVVDRATGLVWKRDLSVEAISWYSALSKCLDIGWRVPNVKELASLLDFTSKECAHWPSVFGGSCLFPTQTWSSTPNMQKPSDAFIVDFSTGEVLTSSLLISVARLRCVKPLSWIK